MNNMRATSPYGTGEWFDSDEYFKGIVYDGQVHRMRGSDVRVGMLAEREGSEFDGIIELAPVLLLEERAAEQWN